MQVSGTLQVAANPYAASLSHSHYHSYYQLHAPGPQDHDLKRKYLGLLLPQQIIEICLTFDLHAPPYVKGSVWPPDINAAIAALQKATPLQVPKENAAEEPAKEGTAAVGSLKSPSPEQSSSARQDVEASTDSQPLDKEGTSSPGPSTSSVPPAIDPSLCPKSSEPASAPAPIPTQPIPPSQPPIPAAQPPQPQPQPAQSHYPQAYAYAHPHAAYPHTPYYPAGYTYPYASYAAPIPNGYPQPPTTYPTQTSVYPSMVPMPHPQQHDGSAADDLPSYEEMIVEALTGCGDPEGWAPKDLFAWMATRYPLQSNFRPSASQALQKAFKRGRFEKSSNGKYRLNATWNGGNTSRRTTRRPQTQSSQSTPGSSAPAPPFTNAPLPHHHLRQKAASSTPTATQPVYQPSQPFVYDSHTHSPYRTQPQASSSIAPGTLSDASATADDDAAAAIEAAKTLLSAINFSYMYQLEAEEQTEGVVRNPLEQTTSSTGVEELLSHVQAILANAEGNTEAQNAQQTGTNGAVATMSTMPPPPPDVTGDPRAELQGQLALLAAQLVDLAKIEDTPEVAQPPMHALLPPTPAPAPAPARPPPAAMRSLEPAPSAFAATPSNHAPAPVHSAPSDSGLPYTPAPVAEEEEDSEDDDMEEVI